MIEIMTAMTEITAIAVSTRFSCTKSIGLRDSFMRTRPPI